MFYDLLTDLLKHTLTHNTTRSATGTNPPGTALGCEGILALWLHRVLQLVESACDAHWPKKHFPTHNH